LSYRNRELCRIRTITTFISLDKDRYSWEKEILKASLFCSELAREFEDNNYIVQSIRIVTNAFGEYLNTESLESAKNDLSFISKILDSAETSGLRVRFAIGEAVTEHEISLVPELICEFGDLCNVCVNTGIDKNGILDQKLIEHSAKAVTQISKITQRGEGNFNFTVNFNCKPLIPYFPASYFKSSLENCFVIGLETPDLLVDVLKSYNSESRFKAQAHRDRLHGYYKVMNEALQYHIDSISEIIESSKRSKEYKFEGFDSSAAPSKSCSSMVEIYEQMGVDYFGSAGTVEASALLTRVFKSIENVDLVGFSGLMLALTEDRGLAKGSIESHFDIRSLLTYSAVCGIGLDTVPIPGNTPVEKIADLMRDTGTMAFRLNKPLTVRVFPVPGLSAGDVTAFKSIDLCNCAVLAVP
jgi:uncharacterized protein